MLSSVGPVRMGWRIADVIVIWGGVVERRWSGGKARAYIGRTRTVSVGFVGLYPVQNLNIDIFKSHVIQAQRHTLDRLQIRF